MNRPRFIPSITVSGKSRPLIRILDQRYLPHRCVIKTLKRAEDARRAICDMEVRGAPLIGVTAAFGLYLAACEAPGHPAAFRRHLQAAARRLKAARPTAVNLAWGIENQLKAQAAGRTPEEKKKLLLENAMRIAAEDEDCGRRIGEHGLKLIRKIARRKKGPVQIMTHCNAGRLAAVAWGTATAPIYAAHRAGIPVHVWVSETRPRNQGASLTAWELQEAGVPYTLVVDNACGHLLQERKADLVIVGCDRMAANGDAANKIGTYLKALAAKENSVPFYVALPSSTIDWKLAAGVGRIPIEDRGGGEVLQMTGALSRRKNASVRLAPEGAKTRNPGFDVTPAKLITGVITERGVCTPARLRRLFHAG